MFEFGFKYGMRQNDLCDTLPVIKDVEMQSQFEVEERKWEGGMYSKAVVRIVEGERFPTCTFFSFHPSSSLLSHFACGLICYNEILLSTTTYQYYIIYCNSINKQINNKLMQNNNINID